MKNLFILFIWISVTASSMASATSPAIRCPDQVKIAAVEALNNLPGLDPKDPFYQSSGTPKLVSEEPLLEGSLPNLKVQTWAVTIDQGIDGGGKFDVGVITIGEGGSPCRLVSGFMYINREVKKLNL